MGKEAKIFNNNTHRRQSNKKDSSITQWADRSTTEERAQSGKIGSSKLKAIFKIQCY